VAEEVRRDRLKPDCPPGRVGSSPTPGTDVDAQISIRLQPRAKREEVVGERGEAIVIRVTAPPVDGKANAALCQLIARLVRVPSTRVAVVRGQTSREKVVRVEGVTQAALRSALLGETPG
jgi:uncharacterized protein